MGEADIRRRVVILDAHRRELLVVRPPSGHQSGLSPWLTHPEVNRASQCPRMNVAFGKWAGFPDRVSADCNRIEEGTGGPIRKRSKQVLVHFQRGQGIAAYCPLNAAVECHDIPAQMDRGVESEIERVICRIAVDDRVGGGHGYLSARVIQLKKIRSR